MTTMFSYRVHDVYEQLSFKDFQDPLTQNSKTYNTSFCFERLSRSWKCETYFQGLL